MSNMANSEFQKQMDEHHPDNKEEGDTSKDSDIGKGYKRGTWVHPSLRSQQYTHPVSGRICWRHLETGDRYWTDPNSDACYKVGTTLNTGVEDNTKNRLEITTKVVVELPWGSAEKTRGCDCVVFRNEDGDSWVSMSHRELVAIVEELGKE